MALPDGVTLVDAFPFDSNPELITDVNGYLAGDRSVDAWTMQNVFKQFFSDGVFGTPADALQIKKGASGLTVTIEPGTFIIRGGMGGIKEDAGALTLTLDTQAAAGNVCYGIMLRYDNNPDMRGLGFRVVKGTAGADPQPPAPDQTSENVMEYRLGYVTVPNGASGLDNAVVTNEKGTSVCPYAAPFDEIDLSAVVDDAKEGGTEALNRLIEYFDTYRDAIDAALSDEEATYLQAQINDILEQLSGYQADLTNEVDNETIEYSNGGDPLADAKLRVREGGVKTGQISDGAVTQEKLSNELQIVLDIVDTTGWGFDEYLDFISGLSGDSQTNFVKQIDQGTLKGWTASQQNQLMAVCNDNSQKYIVTTVGISGKTWPEIQAFYDACNNLSVRSSFIGLKKTETIGSYGSREFVVIGVGHDDITGGGKARLTLTSSTGMTASQIGENGFWCGGSDDYAEMYYPNSGLHAAMSKFYNQIPSGMKACVASVDKVVVQGSGGSSASGTTTFSTQVFAISGAELGYDTKWGCGTKYDGTSYIAYDFNGWTRENTASMTTAYYRKMNGTSATEKVWWGGGSSSSQIKAYPCLCIA